MGLINNNANSGQASCSLQARAVEKAKEDLYGYYLKRVSLRDKAETNTDNIQSAKQNTGRVPADMQIKIQPNVPAKDDVVFCREWAEAVGKAEMHSQSVWKITWKG